VCGLALGEIAEAVTILVDIESALPGIRVIYQAEGTRALEIGNHLGGIPFTGNTRHSGSGDSIAVAVAVPVDECQTGAGADTGVFGIQGTAAKDIAAPGDGDDQRSGRTNHEFASIHCLIP
jgi:pyruvoyl-dependent arginine decarboxylase (PvlArgDC)